MTDTFKEQALNALRAAQMDRPDRVVWILLAVSCVYTFIWLVEVIESRGKEVVK